MSCGISRRWGSDLALLWLWCGLADTAPIRLLAWKLPYAGEAALEKAKRQKKKKKKKEMCIAGVLCACVCVHIYIYNCHLNLFLISLTVCWLSSLFISPSESVWFSFKGGAPNYYPNSFSAPEQTHSALEHCTRYSGDVQRFNSANEDNVTQVKAPLSAVSVAWSFFLPTPACIPPLTCQTCLTLNSGTTSLFIYQPLY